MTAARPLALVDADALPDYPFGPENTLPGNWFMKWEFGRWLTSDMYLHAEPEVGYFYLNLMFKAQMTRPIGTIPADFDGQVAFLDGKVDARKWRALLKQDPSPLQHWRPYRCAGGEVRLGHPVVIDMVAQQLTRRDEAVVRREGEAARKRCDRLRAALAERGVHAGVLRDQTLIERMDQWMVEFVRGRRDVRAYDRVLQAAAAEGWFQNR